MNKMIQIVFKLPLLTILTITCQCDGFASHSFSLPRYWENDLLLSRQKQRRKLISLKSWTATSNEVADQAMSITIPTQPQRMPLSVLMMISTTRLSTLIVSLRNPNQEMQMLLLLALLSSCTWHLLMLLWRKCKSNKRSLLIESVPAGTIAWSNLKRLKPLS